MKFTILSLLALATTATADHPFDLELEWYANLALPGDCTTEDTHEINNALFEGANTVLVNAGLIAYDNLVDRRRNLRTLEDDCDSFCVKACAYSMRLCIDVYSCDCRRRVLIEGEMPSRELQNGLEKKFQDMCMVTLLAAQSGDVGISDPCKAALQDSPDGPVNIGCDAILTPVV